MAAIAVLLALHVGLVLRSYPPSVLMEGEIPLKGDVSRYFATAHGAANVEGLFGYDPYFMAGYPVGLWNSMGKKGFEMAHLLLPCVSLPLLFYLVIVFVSSGAPLLLWAVLRPHCPNRRSAWLLFGLCLLYWHLDANISYFWDFGNVFFPATACMAAVLVVLVWNAVHGKNGWVSAVLAGVVAGLVFYCHTVVLLAALVPVLCALATGGRDLRRPGIWMRVFLALTVFTALAGWWLVPLLRSTDICLARPESWFRAGPKHFIMDIFSDRGYGQPYDRRFLFHAAVVLGIAGIWLRSDSTERGPALRSILAGGGIWALVITYSFSYVPLLAAVQPHRFMIPATVFLLFPAALCIDHMIGVIGGSDRRQRVVVGTLLLILAPHLTAYLIDSLGAPMACGSDADREKIYGELSAMNVRGRVLCDDSDLGRMVPYRTGLPVVGGLSAQAFVKHRFAGFDDHGVLFGRPAGEWDAEALRAYLDAYAVELAILSKPEWLEFARGHEELFESHGSHGNMTIFRVRNAKPSLAMDGAARVCADYDLIGVEDAARRNLILKLHYSPMLQASDGVKLSPEKALDDPVPFIRCAVPEGVTRFNITKK